MTFLLCHRGLTMGKICLILCVILAINIEISYGSDTAQDLRDVTLETSKILEEKLSNVVHHNKKKHSEKKKFENLTEGMEVKHLKKDVKNKKTIEDDLEKKNILKNKKLDDAEVLARIEENLSPEISENPEETTETPEEVPEIKENIPETPEEVTETEENVVEKPEEVTEIEENVIEKPEEVPEIDENISETPEEVTETEENIPETQEEVPEKEENIPVEFLEAISPEDNFPPYGASTGEVPNNSATDQGSNLEINPENIIQLEVNEIENNPTTFTDPLNTEGANNSNIVDRVGYNSLGYGVEGIYLVYHYPTTTSKGIAFGVNSYWVICSTQILPDNVKAKDVRMYSKIMDGETANRLAAKKHKVREIRVHPEKGETHAVQNTMMLLRACPKLTKYFNLPPANYQHTVGSYHSVYNYLPDLKSKGKEVAENCECDEMPGWDKYRQYCLVESQTIYNGPTEKGTISFSSNEIMGINTYQTDDGGEPYLNIVYYLPWIAANTPIPPEDE